MDDIRQTSRNDGQHIIMKMFALDPLRGPLQYGDVVLLRLCSARGWFICSHENPQRSNSLTKLEVSDALEGFSSHVSNIKMLSFEIQDAINNQLTGVISYGSEVKLKHVNSEKFITLGRGDVHLDTMDSQTDTTDIETDITDKPVALSDDSEYCKLKILNPQDVQDNGNLVLANYHQVMFQAQGLYILKWDMRIEELVWHKILNPEFASPESYCTIQIYYHTIYKKFISKLSESSHIKNRLQETLSRDRKNPLIATIKYLLNKKLYIRKVLDQLNFLCEDQDIVMQNYLREQPCESINLVEIISRLFYECSTNSTDKAAYLNTLKKICVGNFENQQIFVSYKTCKRTMEAINEILRQKQRIDLVQLKASAVSMLEILCEEIHPRTVENVQRVYAYVDVIALHETLVECYALKKVNCVANNTAIKIYNLLKHMEDFKGVNCKTVPSNCRIKQKDRDERSKIDSFYLVDDDDNNNNNQKINKWKRLFCRKKILKDDEKLFDKKYRQEAWNYCIRWSRNVEIFYKHGNVASKVYFRLHPEDEMTKKEECIVKHAVNCGAPKRRLRQFLVGMKSIKHKVHPLKGIFQHRCCPLRTNFVIFSESLNKILTLWTVVMNILLIVAWESVDIKREYVYSSPDVVTTANESLLNGYCVDAVCNNNSINSSLFTPDDCNRSLCVSQMLIPSVPDISDHPHWFFNRTLYFCGAIHLIISLLMALSYFIRFTPDVEFPQLNKVPYNFLLFMLDKDKPRDHFKKKIPRYFKIPLRIFLFESIYVIGFAVCSGLSLWLYGYFYPLCLLHIVVGNAILWRILKSITKNSFKLFLIVVLALGVIFIYSVAAFAFFANEFDNLDTQYCESILQCYITIIHFILIHRNSTFPTNFKDFALRVIIFDVSFYVILIVIGISTISAIVTSTFIELREEWWQIERDRRQICFICQKFSSEFEEKAEGFDHHIFNDHYMFNYVYFKLHIEKVDKDKRNAMEKYYLEKTEAENADIFPLRVSKCINDSELPNRCACHRHTQTDDCIEAEQSQDVAS